jgi:tRNA wybutosine-synthesizing protein 1
MIPKKVQELLEKMHYALVGNSSAVQVCSWTKKSLNEGRSCWKEKFYGIDSHRCCQMSPAVMWCENSCLHCWRPIEYNLGSSMKGVKIDDPKEILDKIVEARKQLMIGHKGDKKISKKKLEEAFKPNLFTLSLSGEATLYPKLPDMIKEIRNRKAISFIVTNGQNPEMIKRLEKEGALPTQLTISTNAPNEKLFKIWHNSKKKEAWKKFNETLNLVGELKGKTRRAIRLTLVKELVKKTAKEGNSKLNKISNMREEHAKQYSNLIKKANPDFIHIKGFKALGYSRKRLDYEKQPFHKEVRAFTKKLLKELRTWDKEWRIRGEAERNTVFLLSRRKKKDLKIKRV